MYQVIQYIRTFNENGEYVVEEIPLRSFASLDEAENHASLLDSAEDNLNVAFIAKSLLIGV